MPQITPQQRAAAKHYFAKLRWAKSILENKANYAAVQFWMREQCDKAAEIMQREAPENRTDARMDHAIKLFDIRARAFLELINDQEAQNAYVITLTEFAYMAAHEYTGLDRDFISGIPKNHPWGQQLSRAFNRISYWTKQGYAKMAGLPIEVTGLASEDMLDALKV